jgi:hypothetical protein
MKVVETTLTRLQAKADFLPDEADAETALSIGDNRATPAAAAAMRLLVRTVMGV